VTNIKGIHANYRKNLGPVASGYAWRPNHNIYDDHSSSESPLHPRLLKSFLAVARSGTVTRAAEQVNLAQSSVSEHLQLLEAELGAALFARKRQGLLLTEAGETLKSYAQEILALADEARAAVEMAAGRAAGTLTIGALETIGTARLPQWLSVFRRRQPDIRVNLQIAGSGALLNGLEDGTLDLVFCFDKEPVDGRFVRRTILAEPLVLIVPPEEARKMASAGIESLTSLRFITTEIGCTYRHMLNRAFGDVGAGSPAIAAEVGSITAIGRLVATGVGSAFVPRLAVADLLDRGEVVELPWPGADRTAALIMMWRRRRVLPPALKQVLAAMNDLSPPLRSAGVLPQRAARFPS
jgi:DNA-binding transcriptional LysR family regulator